MAYDYHVTILNKQPNEVIKKIFDDNFEGLRNEVKEKFSDTNLAPVVEALSKKA
jgi:hypothetical protein